MFLDTRGNSASQGRRDEMEADEWVQCSKTERVGFVSYLSHSQERKMDTSLSRSVG